MATTRILPLALALMLLFAQASQVQAGASTAPPSDGFDPARIETVGGTVKEITIIPPGSKSGFIGPGLRLTVQRGSGETLYVPLGPKWYTDQQPLRLAVGDVITLVGMRPDLQKPIFLVQEIRKEEQAASYRDREGIPYWQKYKPVEAPRTPVSPQPESQDEH